VLLLGAEVTGSFMAACLRIQAESRNGLCVLRLSGELDFVTAREFAERADHVLQAVPGPVVMNLSGLTLIDLRGARALAAVTQTLPAGRQVVVCSCPPHVRLTLDVLDLPLNYLPADYLPTENWIVPPSWTRELVHRVQDARLHASVTKLCTKGVLATLTDTSIRLASTRERTDLIREKGQRTLAATRAARELAERFRQESAPLP
jgi:anti-anti-sigma factor